jgi:hypothetical protein
VKLSRLLSKAARLSRDVEAIESGDPAKIAHRDRNRVIGRARVGFWWVLWGGRRGRL